jgi:hypothetical protein
MFGHDDQSQHQDADQTAPDAATTAALTDDDQGLGGGAPAMNDTAGEYIDSDTPTPTATPAAPVVPAMDLPAAAATVTPTVAAATPAATPNTDELLDIKQQALQQLTPLVGHLEQSPEEKFRTTMMMIQASDNAELIKAAYESAMQIPDEKTRAQALLDIVNEINYFTHNSGSEA